MLLYLKYRLVVVCYTVCMLALVFTAISCNVQKMDTVIPVAPEIDFSADVRSGEVPLSVSFTPVVEGVITHWQWDFGDENFSTVSSPTHIYRIGGTYTVSLAVMGPGGSHTETKVDYIHVNPEIISWEEASEYIGQTKTIEGIIEGTYYAHSSKGKPTFLNFHMPYKGYLTCVIWGSDREKFVEEFGAEPENCFLNRHVVVEGLIEEYPAGSGAPEIVLKEPSQIRIIEK